MLDICGDGGQLISSIQSKNGKPIVEVLLMSIYEGEK
jgi:hypothetical protein